ncbi:MAG: hypothetical protein HDR80_00565 [Bacteroides sp.]|nr:hypothetical protein [Bacteroides sp.]
MKKNEILRRQILTPMADIRLRESGEGEAPSRTITGYAILFDTPSEPLFVDGDTEFREVIAPEAVTLDLLDRSDIKFTMYHDHQYLLGRSRQGHGTLRYGVDTRGVSFELDLPCSPNGDEALEMVRRGDISGCSFAFSTCYGDDDCVERTYERTGGRTRVMARVKRIHGIHDFTLTPDPAYPATSVETRALSELIRPAKGGRPPAPEVAAQLAEMRRRARSGIIR